MRIERSLCGGYGSDRFVAAMEAIAVVLLNLYYHFVTKIHISDWLAIASPFNVDIS
ncbi:MAG: hypothetical protein F6J93_25315 [Oscillatoria sp. SIO1A7]|nr:hypothetical protein [Oscillatoria sp. SIO1A7]